MSRRTPAILFLLTAPFSAAVIARVLENGIRENNRNTKVPVNSENAGRAPTAQSRSSTRRGWPRLRTTLAR